MLSFRAASCSALCQEDGILPCFVAYLTNSDFVVMEPHGAERYLQHVRDFLHGPSLRKHHTAKDQIYSKAFRTATPDDSLAIKRAKTQTGKRILFAARGVYEMKVAVVGSWKAQEAARTDTGISSGTKGNR